MPCHSGNSVADDPLHYLGNSGGQSSYATFPPTTSSEEAYPCSPAPQAAPYGFVDAYEAHNTWSTHFDIGPAGLYNETSFPNSGSPPHSQSLYREHASRSQSFSSADPIFPNNYEPSYVNQTHHHTTPFSSSYNRIYHPRINPGLDPTSIPVNYIRGVMPSPPQNFQPTNTIPAENDLVTAEPSATSKKRQRDVLIQDDSIIVDQPERPSKLSRANSSPHIHILPTDGSGVGSSQQGTEYDYVDTTPISPNFLEHHQKDFIQQWVDIFVISRTQANLSNESMNALATLTQARPQLIFEHIQKTYPSIGDPEQSPYKQRLSTNSPHHLSPTDSRKPYSLATANAHLPPTTLLLVTKYITSCRRTRPRTDGRRSVNSGPYRCLHGCTYSTKRAFDWRRHEETHEPQELWLCTLCSQADTPRSDEHDAEGAKREPFMVSRRDKFLRHARECHKGWSPEKVLDLSRVDYRPSEELKCPMCGGRSKSWDERCRHVLGHFEEEVERGLGRGRGGKEGKSAEGSVVSHDESVVSDGSDEERIKEQLSAD